LVFTSNRPHHIQPINVPISWSPHRPPGRQRHYIPLSLIRVYSYNLNTFDKLFSVHNKQQPVHKKSINHFGDFSLKYLCFFFSVYFFSVSFFVSSNTILSFINNLNTTSIHHLWKYHRCRLSVFSLFVVYIFVCFVVKCVKLLSLNLFSTPGKIRMNKKVSLSSSASYSSSAYDWL